MKAASIRDRGLYLLNTSSRRFSNFAKKRNRIAMDTYLYGVSKRDRVISTTRSIAFSSSLNALEVQSSLLKLRQFI